MLIHIGGSAALRKIPQAKKLSASETSKRIESAGRGPCNLSLLLLFFTVRKALIRATRRAVLVNIRIGYPRWMTRSDAPRSARALIRPSPSQRGRQDSTGARGHPQRGSRSQDEAGVLVEELQVVLARRLRRLAVLILRLQQVRIEPPSPCAHNNCRDGANTLAAAAAAKINAQIQAKKGIQHVDVPPIMSSLSPSAKSASPGAPSKGNSASAVNGEMYIADGDYIRDIEVNDLRNRYTLTKGSTQKMVNTPCVAFH
jgi:hypothetical protein